jgi:translation elongation factor EF-Tu-like GTPase
LDSSDSDVQAQPPVGYSLGWRSIGQPGVRDAVDPDARSWTWTVTSTFVLRERGVVAIGEHAGSSPLLGQSCVIRDDSGTVHAAVGGLERFQHREDAEFTHHSWGLLLADVGLDDVRVGAVVTPEVEISRA